MAKTTGMYVRLDPALKEQAESVLSQLGLPMSNAIDLFLKQVVLQQGLPFQVRLPYKPLCWEAMTVEERNAALEEGYQQAIRGEGIPADQAFDEIERELGL